MQFEDWLKRAEVAAQRLVSEVWRLSGSQTKLAESLPTALSVVGGEADAEAELGDRARDRRDWPTAAEHYRKALAARPQWPAIQVQLGHMLKESGEVAAAEAAYRTALSLEPNNADTYLQLGHALKLQNRTAAAREAYLASLVIEPTLKPARDELRALGVGRRIIDQHLAAAAPRGGPRSSGEKRSRSQPATDAVIEQQRAGGPRGMVTEVGTSHIAGEMFDVSIEDLPLTVVCRAGDIVFGTQVLDPPAEAKDRGAFPGNLGFRLDLPASAQGHILHVRPEPGGHELMASPVLLPGDGLTSLLSRIERLEAIVDSGLLPRDVESKLEQRLSRRVAAEAGARVETILAHQRSMFERQLVAAGRVSRSGPESRPASEASRGATEQSFRREAAEYFPGLGWSRAEPGRAGRQRWMCDRASLVVDIAEASAFFIRAQIAEVASEIALKILSLSAGGVAARHWIEPTQPRDDGATSWTLTALLPSAARHHEGHLDIVFNCPHPGPESNQGTVALSLIEIYALPALDSPSTVIGGLDVLALFGWERADARKALRMTRERAGLAIYPVTAAQDAQLVVAGDMPHMISVTLNDEELMRSTHDGTSSSFAVPARLLRSDRANVVIIERSNATGAHDNVSATSNGAVEVEGLILKPVTAVE